MFGFGRSDRHRADAAAVELVGFRGRALSPRRLVFFGDHRPNGPSELHALLCPLGLPVRSFSPERRRSHRCEHGLRRLFTSRKLQRKSDALDAEFSRDIAGHFRQRADRGRALDSDSQSRTATYRLACHRSGFEAYFSARERTIKRLALHVAISLSLTSNKC